MLADIIVNFGIYGTVSEAVNDAILGVYVWLTVSVAPITIGAGLMKPGTIN
jgi:hypothetical protein